MTMSLLQPITIRCANPADPINPRSHRLPALVFGQWAVHPGKSDHDPAGGGRWRLSHAPSGCRVSLRECDDVDENGDVHWVQVIAIAEALNAAFPVIVTDARYEGDDAIAVFSIALGANPDTPTPFAAACST